MLKFGANLTFLYSEYDFLDRFAAAAKAGFRGVEYISPYEYPKERIAELLAQHGLSQVLFNLPAGDWAKGERGIACHPGRLGEFQDGVGRAIEYAQALGCRQVNCLAGIAEADVPRERQHAALVANLKFAALKLKEAGVKLLIEPVNTRDIPGFYLTRSQQALEVIDEVGSDNLYLQYDVYHMQVMEGDLAHTIETHLARIAHMQIADNPGRHEPGTGEINYPFLFALIERLGYQGWIGCEYKPRTTTDESLGWMRGYAA
jgi:hydroxypyruvate isomerase